MEQMRRVSRASFLLKGLLAFLAGMMLVPLVILGLQRLLMWFQYQRMQRIVGSIEARRSYHPDLLYHQKGGEPLFLVNPENRKTLFFMEGFRTQSPSGMYMAWFRELFERHGFNIVVAVYGIQSCPFFYRNRDWSFHEDMRQAVQVYDAYTALLPGDHRVITMSQSFGALPHLAIVANARRRPDRIALLSPLNAEIDFRVSGALNHWLSRQTSWLRHIVWFAMARAAPDRASVWDIVNREKNLEMAALDDINPEDSTRLGSISEKAGRYVEESLAPRVRNMPILMSWGDSDLYFSQRGFERLAELFRTGGNRVETMQLRNSGHMVLLDNESARLKARLLAFFEA
jgi:pimeloyl-ACP methyl ester carboxylesterase